MKILILALAALKVIAQVPAVDLSGTHLQSIAPANFGAGSDITCTTTSVNYAANGQFYATVTSWGGAIIDTKRSRLVQYGGGHQDYCVTSIQALTPSSATAASVSLIDGPHAFNFTGGCPTTSLFCEHNPDGSMVSRHPYNGIVYLPIQDAMYQFGGARSPNGTGSNATWLYLFGSSAWLQKDPVNGFDPTSVSNSVTGASCAYDSFTQTVWCDDGNIYYLIQYDPVTNTYTLRNNGGAVYPIGGTPAIDPVRRKMYWMGTTGDGMTFKAYVLDISGADSTYTPVEITSSVTGCSGMTADFPGFVYDPDISRFVGYPNQGNTIYIFDPGELTCAPLTFASPAVPTGNPIGTFGRFNYIPSLGAYFLCNDVNNDCFSFTLNPSAQHGLGHSTLTCLDRDGDGYGVGPGCTGPDADDLDAAVHTAAQGISKYGSLTAFLNKLGYNPANIWYVSTSGTDTGSPAACKNTVASPCATFAYIYSHGFAAGDMILARGGTWAGVTVTPTAGTAGHPSILMSYPGEQAYINNTGTTNAIGVDLTGHSWIVVDGIKAAGGLGNSGCIGGGLSNTNIEIRNTETTVCSDGGIDAFDGLSDWTIELNVMHDFAGGSCGSCQHALYMGSRMNPSVNVSIRRNILYNANQYPAFQWNGRVTNLVVDQNILYGTPQASCIGLLEGVSQSRVTNNVCFNNVGGLVIENYDGDCYVGGSSGICPYDQTGNVIENNTFYVGDDTDGSTTTSPALQVENLSTGCPMPVGGCTPTKVGNLGGNTFRNNNFISTGSVVNYRPVIFPLCTIGTFGGACTLDTDETTLATSIFQNNNFWSYGGYSGPEVLGTGPNPGFGYTGHTLTALNAGLWSASSSGNLNSNPMFTAASPSYWNSPSSFDFRLQSGSPGISAGATTSMPLFDVLGVSNAIPPNLGAYQSSSTVTPSGSSIGGNVRLGGNVVIR